MIILCSITAISAESVDVTNSSHMNLKEDVSIEINEESLINANSNNQSISSNENHNDIYENNDSSAVDLSSTVKSKDMSKYYKGSTQYSAVFFDNHGNVLANHDVTISVGGKLFTKKTNSQGVASLAINLNPGSYKVISTNPVTGYKLTTTFTVLSTISSGNTYKVIGDGKKFSAKFFKNDGNPLSGQYIKFKIKGKTYKVKTDSKGQAALSLKKFKKGTYKIICYNKDGLSKSYTIRIYNKLSTRLVSEPYTFFINEAKTIKVKLLNAFGDPVSSGKVKITVNAKTYSKKTNKNGEAYLKLPSLKKGVYILKFKFAGSKHYKKSGGTNFANIITENNTVLTVKSTRTFGYGAGTEFKVAATAGGVGLAKRTVTFNIDGKTYSKTTDKNGIASLPVNLDVGNYTITYSIKGDSKINDYSTSANIIVKKRLSAMIIWKSSSSFNSPSQTFKVLLKDEKGKAISGQTVKLTIKSRTFTATTTSRGYATFDTIVDKGNYKVSVKFMGNNNYLASSLSQPVKITFNLLLKNGVNQKYSGTGLAGLLKSSSHCKVGSAKLKALVKSLTKGLTTKVEKATAIFNYVRDEITYSYYDNTHRGSMGTLKAKKGNCVDQSHLLVAMYRTAGLPARYVHGTGYFYSGHVYGHVWTQVLVGKYWVCADATSYKNNFGKINNWNIKSYTLHSKYSSLPF